MRSLIKRWTPALAALLALGFGRPARAAESLLDPKVSVNLTNAPLAEAAVHLQKLSGIAINVAKPVSASTKVPTVALTADKERLSAVLVKLAKAAGASLAWEPLDAGWQLTPGAVGATDARPTAAAGTYQVKLNGYHSDSNTTQTWRNPDFTFERFDLELAAETSSPLAAYGLSGLDGEVTVLIDGQPVATRNRGMFGGRGGGPGGPGGPGAPGGPGGNNQPQQAPPLSARVGKPGVFDVALETPKGPLAQFSVSGRLLAYSAPAERTFAFDAPTVAAQTQSDGDVDVTISRWMKAEGGLYAQVMIKRSLGAEQGQTLNRALNGQREGILHLTAATAGTDPTATTATGGRGGRRGGFGRGGFGGMFGGAGISAASLGDQPLNLDEAAVGRWFSPVVSVLLADGTKVPVALRGTDRVIKLDGENLLTVSFEIAIAKLAGEPKSLTVAVVDAGEKTEPVPFKIQNAAAPAGN